MSDPAPKRFWQTTSVVPEDGGFAIALDNRRVKTPAKAALVLPTRAMADAVAAEWQAQDNRVNPATMPVTRSANAAIDKVRHQHGEVADMLAAYGDSDLLCYRADGPEALIARQSREWDPALDWAAHFFGTRLQVHSGVIHASQGDKALNTLTKHVSDMSDFQLAAFHDLVGLSGSLILAFCVIYKWKTPDLIWDLSRLDEIWQQEQWGQDDEADAMADIKRRAFLHAGRFYEMA